MVDLSPAEWAYLFFLGAVLAASMFGVWTERFDDSTPQRAGMVLAIFGSIGEIQGLLRQVDTNLSPLMLFVGSTIFLVHSVIRLRS